MQKVGRVRNTMSALYLAFAVFLVESGFLFPASAADYQYILNTYRLTCQTHLKVCRLNSLAFRNSNPSRAALLRIQTWI